MFRKGGNVGTGIMTGIVDRTSHAVDGGPVMDKDYEQMFMEKVIGSGGLPGGMDPLTSYLLAAGPKIAGSTSFSDMISNLEGPNKALIEQQNKKAEAMRNLKTGAASFGLEAQLKRDLLKEEWDARKEIAGMNETGMDPFKLGSYEAFRKAGDSHTVAKNKANYDVDFEEKLTEKIDRNRVGGIIDIDITDKKKFIDWATNKKMDRVGKVFYDPRDGLFKQLQKTSQGYSFKMFGPTVESVVLERETRIPHKDREKKRVYPTGPDEFKWGIGEQIPEYMR